MRDLPTSLDLLALARELLLDELAPLLPPERRRDAHLIATTMAIVAREAKGEEWQGKIDGLISELYEAAPHALPLPVSGEREGSASRGGEGQPLLHRFAADLRNGGFETSPSREAAARAILWRLTIEKLREANPHFLNANGLSDANGKRAVSAASERQK
jgi:hypothetical protein